MSPALDDVAFLARSEHRTEVLDRLAGDAWTRRELNEATGISQPTLGRILSGFSDVSYHGLRQSPGMSLVIVRKPG